MSQDQEKEQAKDSWYEEFKVQGDELMTNVRKLIDEGNVRRLFIKGEDGETILEIPFTAGVVVTAASAIFAPVLVAIGAIAALITRVTIGVERVQADGDESSEDSSSEESAPVDTPSADSTSSDSPSEESSSSDAPSADSE